MNLCGLQVAAASLVRSFGIAPAGAQRGLRHRRAAIQGDVIMPGTSRAGRSRMSDKGRQIAHGRRRRDPVGTGCDL